MNTSSSIVDGSIDPLQVEKQVLRGTGQQDTNLGGSRDVAHSSAIETILENIPALSAAHIRGPSSSRGFHPGLRGCALDSGDDSQMPDTIHAAVEKDRPVPASVRSRSVETAAASLSSAVAVAIKTAKRHTDLETMTAKPRGRPGKGIANALSDTKMVLAAPGVGTQRIRERNRAAAKCRSRRRLEEDRLKAKHQHVQKHHHALSTNPFRLREEVDVLRNMLLAHGTCDCWLIQDYLKRATSKWVSKQLMSRALSVAV